MSVEMIVRYDCPVYLIQHPCVKETGQLIVTSPYGMRDSGFHYGIDSTLFANNVGNLGTIVAFADGKVTYIWDKDPDNKTYQQNSGNTVVIDHGNGYTTKYFHLALGVSNYVKVGQTVKKGDAIGYMGNTGASRGNHLHFEILINNSNVDPLPYMLGEKVFDMSTKTTVKTYEVVTTINGYNTADNAAKQQNATVQIAPGTYYVFNKYPDGVNGMYNITKDTTGAAAWCWVNPKENVKQENSEAEKYKNTPVYDLPYPNKVLIIDKNVKRTNEDCVKCIKKTLEVNPNFDVNIAKAFFEIAPIYGIDPMMAFSQSILETGWFTFSSPGEIVTPDQHNYGAMGVTDTGVKGDIYDTIEDGVHAQMQHLSAYASKDGLPDGVKILDKRYSLVTKGIAPYWQQLAGRWAYPGYEKAKFATPYDAMLAGNTYGQLILARYEKLLTATVSEEDVKKYFQEDNVVELETLKAQLAEANALIAQLKSEKLELQNKLSGFEIELKDKNDELLALKTKINNALIALA